MSVLSLAMAAFGLGLAAGSPCGHTLGQRGAVADDLDVVAVGVEHEGARSSAGGRPGGGRGRRCRCRRRRGQRRGRRRRCRGPAAARRRRWASLDRGGGARSRLQTTEGVSAASRSRCRMPRGLASAPVSGPKIATATGRHFKRAADGFTRERSSTAWSRCCDAGLGHQLAGSRVLEVRGAQDGDWRQTPVNRLASTAGATSSPRAAPPSGCATCGSAGGGRWSSAAGRGVPATEEPMPTSPDPPRAYLEKWKWEVGAFYDGVGPTRQRRRARPGRPRPPRLQAWTEHRGECILVPCEMRRTRWV